MPLVCLLQSFQCDLTVVEMYIRSHSGDILMTVRVQNEMLLVESAAV